VSGHRIIPCFLDRKAIEDTPAYGHDSADEDPEDEEFHDLLGAWGFEESVGLCGNGKFVEGLRYVVAGDRPEKGLRGVSKYSTICFWSSSIVDRLNVLVRRVSRLRGLRAGLNPI
jgi:hypothetical protein